MNSFDIASQTVLEALRTGQAGQPVAARVTAHLDADHGRIERLTARVLGATAAWFNSPPERVTAFGGVDKGHVSALTLFEGGQSALVSVGSCGTSDPLLELVVWGNRGILSWEHNVGFRSDDQQKNEPQLSDPEKRLLDMVRASLRSGRSMRVDSRDSAESDPGRGDSSHFENRRRQSRTTQSQPKPRPRKPPYGVLLVSGDYTHQPGYVGNLANDPRCKLIGLTDEEDLTPRRRRLNEQLTRRLGIPLLPDLSQALRRDDVDVVSICAEPVRRGRIIVEAAQAGKHLYLDKPLAASLAEADAIRKAVSEAGVVSHMWSLVRSETVTRMQREIQSARLGELTAFHADLCFAKGPAGTAALKDRRRESKVPERYELADSKRELSNVGVYPLVSLLHLQDKTVRRVCATTGNYFFREHQTNNMEDFGHMLLELDGGTIATISAGRTGWKSYPGGGLNRTCLMGEHGAAVFDTHRPRVAVWADVAPWRAPERDPEDPMGMWGPTGPDRFVPKPRQAWITPRPAGVESDVAYFLDCIEAGRRSDVSAGLAATATEVLLAGYQSAATGDVVELPLLRDAG